jgi:hypothetical protein
MSNHEVFAHTVRPLEFTDKHNALRIVRKPAGTVVSVYGAGVGTLILTVPQTGLTATATKADVYFTHDPLTCTLGAHCPHPQCN